MQNCYDIITGKCNNLPGTFIRLDVSHLVSIICRWNCIKQHPLPKVRQFFIRAICHIYKMQNLQDVEYFLESLLAVALSESIGTCEKHLEFQTRYNHVSNVIKGTVIKENEEAAENLRIIHDEVNIENDCCTGWLEWSNTLYDKACVIAEHCRSGDTLNAFYSIEIAKKIKRLMNYLPIWTCIMLSYFKVDSVIATSSSVESEFANVKCRVFKNELPLRVDKFIIRHLEYIDGRIKEASTNYSTTSAEIENNNIIDNNNNEKTHIASNHLENASDPVRSLNECENWGGLCNTHSKKKKPNYLDPCSDWDYVQTHKVVHIPILKNGNLCNSIRVDGTHVLIKETCAFDSVLQLIMHAIGKDCHYKEIVQQLDHSMIQLGMSVLNRGKVTASDYIERIKILEELDISKKSVTRHMKIINANCNVAHLTDILFYKLPTVTQIKSCNVCNFKQTRHFPHLHINVGILIKKGLGAVQEAINDMKFNDIESTCKCNKCVGIITRKHEYGPHVFLDTSLITDPNYENETHVQSMLDSITKFITVENKNYIMCGIINYISYCKEKLNGGHYIAMVYTGIQWYEYDDLKKTRNFVSPQKTVTPHIIMYVTQNI